MAVKSFKNARAYIFWGNVWRHVYIYRTYDQMTLEGGSVKMAEFRLSKNTKISYSAELSSFHKNRPKAYKPSQRIA